MQEYRSVNPASAEQFAQYESHSDARVAAALAAAHAAFREWRSSDLATRAKFLIELAAQLRARRDDFARLMAMEMGKPVRDGLGEIEKCARLCEYYAEHAPAFAADQEIPGDAAHSRVRHRPLGIVFAIMPWNFPFWQVLRAVVPATAAGNAVVLKHAPNVPGCALALEEIVRAALSETKGPPELFANLFVSHEQAGAIIDHALVRSVSFTGSTRAGRSIGARAGAALKPCVLELGGSDPYLIFADADLDRAAALCVQSRLLNGGQSCIAAKRLIAVAEIYDEFLAAVLKAMRSPVMGDPLQPETTLGPLARPDLRDTLHAQVKATVAEGARLLLGGEIPGGPKSTGSYYPPTLLADVTPDMPAGCEELFGPAAAVLRADDEAHAIELANATNFGLGAAIFTGDPLRAEDLVSAMGGLEAGSVFINDFVKSDPRLPFGGIKDSGYGRELGQAGFRAFTNMQTIVRA